MADRLERAERRGMWRPGRVLRWCGAVAVCGGLITFAWAGEGDAPLDRLWRLDPSAPPAELQRDAAPETRELVTLEEAVAMALQANWLVRSRERQRFIAESVKQAYAETSRAHRTLTLREAELRSAREVERVVAELAARGRASALDAARARAALAMSVQDVQDARTDLALQTRQLNHLMGRDPRAHLRVIQEPSTPTVTTPPAGTSSPSGD